MPKFNLHHIEFYITNVCNLNCSNCRTFNNFKFKGHYEFQYELYHPWSKILELGSIEILGGEPTLHPRLKEWMIGIRKLWPKTEINLATNGTYLRQLIWLHDIAAEHNINIKVSAHSKDLRHKIVDEIFAAFGHCEVINLEKHGQNVAYNRINIKTKKNVNIIFQTYEHFQISPLRNNQFEFYQSDPVKAHRHCQIANCHHMIDGQLYKCGFVSTAANFLTQQNQAVPQLLQQYKPLNPADVIDQTVLLNFQKHIPQCSLCHESNPTIPLESKFKKNIKIHNLANNHQQNIGVAIVNSRTPSHPSQLV